MDATPKASEDLRTPGVIARPPYLFLAALLLGHVGDHFLPLPFVVPTIGALDEIVGACLIVIGLAIFVAGIRNFTRADTPVPTKMPARALVTTGIHGRTRNPIYVGMFLMCGGLALALRSPWTVLLMLPLAITMRYGVVAREEEYLERRFGADYRAYKHTVRRWF